MLFRQFFLPIFTLQAFFAKRVISLKIIEKNKGRVCIIIPIIQSILYISVANMFTQIHS